MTPSPLVKVVVEKKFESSKLVIVAAKEGIRRAPRARATRNTVLFDNYANARMIVGQYVLGIKVPGRSNLVIFMISGR